MWEFHDPFCLYSQVWICLKFPLSTIFFPGSSSHLQLPVHSWGPLSQLGSVLIDCMCVCVCVCVCACACVRAHKTVFVSVLTCVHAFVDIIQNIQIPNRCKKEEKKERPFNLHSPTFFMPVTQEVPEKVDKNWQYWPCWATHVLLPRITAWLASPSSVLLSSWQHNTDTLAFKGNYPLPPPLPPTHPNPPSTSPNLSTTWVKAGNSQLHEGQRWQGSRERQGKS